MTTNDIHQRISPTARLVTYFRSFSDIPYAQEVARLLHAEELAREVHQDDLAEITAILGPLAEARYKCFDRLLDAHPNVIELAAGLSVERGLSVSSDPERRYVGTDLQQVVNDSKRLLDQLGEQAPPNHHLEVANVLSYDQLRVASRHLEPDSEVLVLHEGLWQFLTAEEQSLCARNIHRLLEQHGGCWVTPDIADLESSAKLFSSLGPSMEAALKRVMRRIADMTGRQLEKNYFLDQQDALAFFRRSGFEVHQYEMIDDPIALSSATALWGEREKESFVPGMKQQKVWVMSVH